MKIRQYSNIPILRPEIVWDKDIWQNSMPFVCWKSDCWPKIKTKPPLRNTGVTCIDHLCLRERLTKSWKSSFDVYICMYVNVYVCEMYISVIAVYKIFICVWAILKSHLNLHAEALECQIKSDLWKYPTGLQQRFVYFWKVSPPEKYLDDGPVKWDRIKRPSKSGFDCLKSLSAKCPFKGEHGRESFLIKGVCWRLRYYPEPAVSLRPPCCQLPWQQFKVIILLTTIIWIFGN